MGKSRSKLKKSTVITMVSCGSFVVMTFLALLFFIKFPITPSEKIMASIGRESIYRKNNVEGLEVTTTAAQTTATTVSQTTASQTTTAATTHSEFVITITTGKGFFTGGRIPTVPYMPETEDYYDGYSGETTTVEENYGETYTESDYNYDYNYDYGYDYDYGYGYDYNYDWNY